MKFNTSLVAGSLLLIAACNDENALPEVARDNASATATAFSDQTILGKVYAPQVSVPDGFYEMPVALPAQSYTLRHLRTVDLDPAATPASELCTDDMSQALSWSDAATPDTTVTVVTTVEERDELFQITRQDGVSTDLQRVFKCAYLNRDGVDPFAVDGPAGRLSVGSDPAGKLRRLSEYLWQFSRFGNPGAAVLASSSQTRADGWSHTLELAIRISSGARTPGCDLVQRIDWRHTLNLEGVLSTQQELVREFAARTGSNGPELCSDS